MGEFINPTCCTCRFWIRCDDSENKEYGRCMRYPPATIAIEDEAEQFRPYVLEQDFCGEHLPKYIG